MDEVFFPFATNSPKGIGSCYAVKLDGQARLHDVDDLCLDSYGKWTMKSPFSKRDAEYDLLNGMLNFLEVRPEAKR